MNRYYMHFGDVTLDAQGPAGEQHTQYPQGHMQAPENDVELSDDDLAWVHGGLGIPGLPTDALMGGLGL